MDSSIFLHRFGAPPTARFDRRALLLGTGVTAAAMLLPDRVSARQATPAAAGHTGHAGGGIPEAELVRTAEGISFPAEIGAGLTRVTMVNDAEGGFHAFSMRIPDGVTDDDLAVLLEHEEPPAWFWTARFTGSPDQAPPNGGTVTGVVPYEPGRYLILNVFEGSTAMFTVTGEVEPRPAPIADVEVGLVDVAFHGLDAPLAAGPQIWRLTNHGTMWHDITIFRAPAGATADDFVAALMADEEAFPPAGYDHVGGIGAMSAGHAMWLELDLAAGTYLGACFLPTPDGTPHAMLGMLTAFEVE